MPSDGKYVPPSHPGHELNAQTPCKMLDAAVPIRDRQKVPQSGSLHHGKRALDLDDKTHELDDKCELLSVVRTQVRHDAVTMIFSEAAVGWIGRLSCGGEPAGRGGSLLVCTTRHHCISRKDAGLEYQWPIVLHGLKQCPEQLTRPPPTVLTSAQPIRLKYLLSESITDGLVLLE